jgi:hypothetical protein
MKAVVGHIGINLSNEGESFDFWKGLLTFLEFDILQTEITSMPPMGEHTCAYR